ncbi:MAG TPA: hypothetical protein VD971_13700 [Phycisphaerales bacterium]|nr:hypothetical protein [Phycisphaerales bacterium]
MGHLMLSVSGCRGVVGETLTPEVAARFAGCFGAVVRESAPGSRVVLGRDGRRGCEMVHAAAVAGLLGAGCDVVDLGVAMTPTTAVMADTLRTGPMGVGMVLTASHNPQEWNGLKCLLGEPALHGAGACAPAKRIADEVISRFRDGRPALTRWDGVGTLTGHETSSETHIERVRHAVTHSGLTGSPATLARGVRVAVDCVNASASRTAPLLLRGLGCEVVAINAEVQGEKAGLFPHPPEPTAENLSGAGGLSDAVRSERCSIGFALDPDADRLALVDETGRYIGEEYTLALSAWAILLAAQRSGMHGGERPALVTNLSTSRMLDDVAARFGARVVRTPVGEANVVEAMKRESAIAGGEGNGGTIWPRSCYVRDSLAGMALVLWLMSPAGAGLPLSRLVREIPSYAIEKRKIDLASKDQAAAAVAAVAKHFAAHRVDVRDGAWVDIASGPLAGKAWLHVRASNTEPIMRLIAEAPTSAEAKKVLDEAQRAVAGR